MLNFVTDAPTEVVVAMAVIELASDDATFDAALRNVAVEIVRQYLADKLVGKS